MLKNIQVYKITIKLEQKPNKKTKSQTIPQRDTAFSHISKKIRQLFCLRLSLEGYQSVSMCVPFPSWLHLCGSIFNNTIQIPDKPIEQPEFIELANKLS